MNRQQSGVRRPYPSSGQVNQNKVPRINNIDTESMEQELNDIETPEGDDLQPFDEHYDENIKRFDQLNERENNSNMVDLEEIHFYTLLREGILILSIRL